MELEQPLLPIPFIESLRSLQHVSSQRMLLKLHLIRPVLGFSASIHFRGGVVNLNSIQRFIQR
jgi:hypothetical protein